MSKALRFQVRRCVNADWPLHLNFAPPGAWEQIFAKDCCSNATTSRREREIHCRESHVFNGITKTENFWIRLDWIGLDCTVWLWYGDGDGERLVGIEVHLLSHGIFHLSSLVKESRLLYRLYQFINVDRNWSNSLEFVCNASAPVNSAQPLPYNHNQTNGHESRHNRVLPLKVPKIHFSLTRASSNFVCFHLNGTWLVCFFHLLSDGMRWQLNKWLKTLLRYNREKRKKRSTISNGARFIGTYDFFLFLLFSLLLLFLAFIVFELKSKEKAFMENAENTFGLWPWFVRVVNRLI